MKKQQSKILVILNWSLVDSLIREFENMQNKYVLNDKYKFSIDQVKEILNKIHRQM